MALTRTTLTARIGASDITIPVLSTSVGFPLPGVISLPQQMMQIDDEYMFIIQVPVAGMVSVRSRGAQGTVAAAHDINATVITSPNLSDFPVPPPAGLVATDPRDFPDLVTYGQDGVIATPVVNRTTALLAKSTSAGNYTLGVPSISLNGLILTLVNTSGLAHVVTPPVGTTGVWQTGTAGTPFTTLTFPAQPGSSVMVMAVNGQWAVQTAQGAVTFS